MSVVTIGLDLAKSVFQVHGVDAAGNTVLRRRLGMTTTSMPSSPAEHERLQAILLGQGSGVVTFLSQFCIRPRHVTPED
jgi:hypothetical protein